ncbi:MAG: hypothetical protein ACJ74W_22045 [Pyrinomonadaceae bacterium]
MASVCKCGLDFGKLRTTVNIQTLVDDETAVTMDGVYLYCSACRRKNRLDLDAYGFFQREKDGVRFYRWHSAPTKIAETKKRDGYEFKVEELTLEFPGGLIAQQKFSVEQMCYPAVPVFGQLDGSLKLPYLPVDRRFLGLVDGSKEIRAEPTGRGGEYRFRFHLRVLAEPVEIVRPAIQLEEGKRGTEDETVFQGVHLALWPKTTYQEWRRYFLRLGCAKEHSAAFSNQLRTVKAWAHASSSLDEQRAERRWLLLDVVGAEADKGYTRFGLVESRPDWVAIEFQSPGRGDMIGGGVWRIESAADTYPDNNVEIGLDFGTSNTCIASRTAAGMELLPIRSCDEFIIHGSELPDVLDFPDTWPPRQGFGRNKALLPTELLTQQNLNDLRSRAKQVKDWRPVVDYTIPSSGLEVRYPEKEHVLAEFKWANMIADAAFQPQAAELQKRYLEFLLLLGLAELTMQNSIGQGLNVKFSYPLAFDKNERDQLALVLKESAQAAARQTGVNITIESPMDESRAAAQLAGNYEAGDAACLYVDIGGGSTDIALLRIGIDGPDRYTYICSFKYAGTGLAVALAEGGCLRPGSDLSHFRRRIREVGNVKELLTSEVLFQSQKRNAITAKSAYFYAYLRQFLARLLAAHIVTGEWQEGLSAEAQNAIRLGGYQVLLYPLGNGWGFGNFIDPDYASETFCQRLTAEANAIIEEALRQQAQVNGAPAPADLPRIKVKGQSLKAISGPKSAVAIGVLTSTHARKVAEPGWESRTIVGWTTQVSISRNVPWYAAIDGEGAQTPKGEQPLPSNPILNCPEGEWPAFPAKLPTPHQLDPNLDQTRPHLSVCNPKSIEHYWFYESPFHILLEKLFKPALKELV